MQENENREENLQDTVSNSSEVNESYDTRSEVVEKTEGMSPAYGENDESEEDGEGRDYNREGRGERRYERRNQANQGRPGSMGNRRPRGGSRKGGSYSRRKVSRLYKILGSDKKVWDEKIDYKNVELLRNFITEAGKISPRRTTGVSPIYHRKIVREIKKARMIALLPFKAGE